VEYLVVGGLFAVFALIALVFILGSRAMSQSRSENGEPDERR
jgi:hypothetical protein